MGSGTGTPIAQGAPAAPQTQTDFQLTDPSRTVRSPEQLAFEQQVGQGQTGGLPSSSPSSFDGFAGIPNPPTGDLVQTGDTGIPDDFDFQPFIDSQPFTPASSVSTGSAFADDDFADFKNFGGFFPGEARELGLSSIPGLLAFSTGQLPGFEPSASSIPLNFNPETVLSGSREEAFLQTLDPNFKVGGAQPASPAPLIPIDEAAVLPSLAQITRQVEEFERRGPQTEDEFSQPFNEAAAQQQIQAGNIAAALQEQTGRNNPFLDAILRGRDRAQAERQRRTKQTGSPTGGLPQVAGVGEDILNFIKRLGQPGSSDFLRLKDKNRNSKASPSNTIPGVSRTGQSTSRFGRDTQVERQVPLSKNFIEQAVQARNRGESKRAPSIPLPNPQTKALKPNESFGLLLTLGEKLGLPNPFRDEEPRVTSSVVRQRQAAPSVLGRAEGGRLAPMPRPRPEMPVAPMPRPRPTPAGLAATPEGEESFSFGFSLDDVTDYVNRVLSGDIVSENLRNMFSSGGEEEKKVTKEVEITSSPNSLVEDLATTIKSYEGPAILKARKPVKDDPFTIGYGRTRDLEGNPITKGTTTTQEEAEIMLQEDIALRLPEIRRAYPNFDSYPRDLQVQIGQSYYRGTLTPGHSPETRKLINQGKFKEAAKEFLDNKEYRTAKQRGRSGIRDRMEDVAKALRNYEPRSS